MFTSGCALPGSSQQAHRGLHPGPYRALPGYQRLCSRLCAVALPHPRAGDGHRRRVGGPEARPTPVRGPGARPGAASMSLPPRAERERGS